MFAMFTNIVTYNVKNRYLCRHTRSVQNRFFLNYFKEHFTVHIGMFAHYLFSRISCSANNAQKYYTSEKINHFGTHRTNSQMRENIYGVKTAYEGYMHENLAVQKYLRLHY